jgi:hypothetical protein
VPGRSPSDPRATRGGLRDGQKVTRSIREGIEEGAVGGDHTQVVPRRGREEGDGVCETRVIGDEEQRSFARHVLLTLYSRVAGQPLQSPRAPRSEP